MSTRWVLGLVIAGVVFTPAWADNLSPTRWVVWDHSPDFPDVVVHYRLKQGPSTGSYVTNWTIAATDTAFELPLCFGTSFSVVTSLDKFGTEGEASNELLLTATPPVVSNVTVRVVNQAALVQWAAVTWPGVTYRIRYCTFPSTTATNAIEVGGFTNSFTLTNCPPGDWVGTVSCLYGATESLTSATVSWSIPKARKPTNLRVTLQRSKDLKDWETGPEMLIPLEEGTAFYRTKLQVDP